MTSHAICLCQIETGALFGRIYTGDNVSVPTCAMNTDSARIRPFFRSLWGLSSMNTEMSGFMGVTMNKAYARIETSVSGCISVGCLSPAAVWWSPRLSGLRRVPV